MKKTYLYALDLSLNSTGVCLFTNDGRFYKALTIDTHSEKETKLKLNIIGTKFLSLMEEYTPSIVVIEQGFSLFNASTQALFKVHGLVNYLFAQYEQIYYPASTVKKIIAGKGNVTKEEVRDAIIKKYPKVKFSTLDESDAFAVGETYFIKKGISDAKTHI
jgi:Holliday junction resolvasome RuvABC endonuclease subunit